MEQENYDKGGISQTFTIIIIFPQKIINLRPPSRWL